MPKLLDLYSCAGGAAMGYHRAGFQTFGVDIDPQPNYPFPFLQMDALQALEMLLNGHPLTFAQEVLYLADFDVIHASPPCQSYLSLGAVNKALGRTYEYPDLVAATRDALVEIGKPYVIENVVGAPLHNPVQVCGTGLDLPLRRHRKFESNVPLEGVLCAHNRFTEPKYWTSWRPNGEVRLSTVVQVYGNGGNTHEWPDAMGIHWMTNREMAEAIPPAYTEWIGTQLIRQFLVADPRKDT